MKKLWKVDTYNDFGGGETLLMDAEHVEKKDNVVFDVDGIEITTSFNIVSV